MNSEEPRDQPRTSGLNLNFTLPEPTPNKKPGLHLSLPQLLTGLAALLVLNLIATVVTRPGAGSAASSASTPGAPWDAATLKNLALKLEQQGLAQPAAEAWGDYLDTAAPDAPEAAGIFYRIGKLHQEARSFEPALAAYYRAEALKPGDDLTADLGRRIGECLEAMGRFAALRHELADRVSIDPNAAKAGSAVVAEIGKEPITEAELDRKIEERIESELARFGGQLSETQRSKQKEAMLNQLSGGAARLQFLQQLIAEEVLYRKARQTGLAEKPEVRRQLEESQRGLLAGLVLQRRVEDFAKITEDEVKARYEANKESLRIPESLKLSRVKVDTEEAAKARIAQGSEGTDWEPLPEPITQGRPIPDLKPETVLDPIWKATTGSVAPQAFPGVDGKFYVFRLGERTASRIPPFEEVADQLAQEVQQAKEERVRGELLDQLRREFDVVLHTDQFPTPEAGAAPKQP